MSQLSLSAVLPLASENQIERTNTVMVRNISDTRIPSDEGPPKSFKVIAAGLPRCGTTTLQSALESPSLGYNPTMHMAEIIPHASQEKLVIDALRESDRERRQKLLHEIFDGYAATTAFPGSSFIPELMDMYPDAKIILNTRGSAKAWSSSIKNSLAFFETWRSFLIGMPWKTDRLNYRMHQETYKKWQMDLELERDEIFSEKHYDRHNQWVRDEARTRGREVFEHRAEHGWEPLCKFMGVKAPGKDVEYPWLNDAAAITRIKMILVARGLLTWGALGGFLFVWWYSGRGRI